MAKNVLVLKHFEAPKEAGVYFRLVCLTGATKGESFVILGNRAVIGRGEKVDIRINDTKASREHAEIAKVGQNWVVTDLGSQNGIMVNDKKVTQMEISEGDRLIVGQTVFKFTKVDVTNKNKVSKQDLVSEEDKKSKSILPVLVFVIILSAVFLMDDGEKKPEKRNQTRATTIYQDVNTEFADASRARQENQNKQMKETKEKLNVIYQRGLRELRERNYYRAIHEFNLALIIAPGDSQAEYYRRKTKEQLDKEIEGYQVSAQRDETSLKYSSAIVSYCAIVRLLHTASDDPRHKNAIKQINDLESKIGIETGETECLKKQRTDQ